MIPNYLRMNPATQQQQFPSNLQPSKQAPLEDDTFKAFPKIIREEIAGVNKKVSDILRHINEIGTRTEALETNITDITMTNALTDMRERKRCCKTRMKTSKTD